VQTGLTNNLIDKDAYAAALNDNYVGFLEARSNRCFLPGLLARDDHSHGDT
jgi:hypothetical protein